MRWSLFVGLAALAACTVVSAASGQSEEKQIGSNLKPRELSALEHDRIFAVRRAHNMAGCLAGRRRSQVVHYLRETDPATAGRLAAVLSKGIACASITGGNDLATDMAFITSDDVYRGNLAEALLADLRGAASLPALPLARTYETPYVNVSGRAPSVEEMAVCVASTSPAEVIALLKTDPASDQERDALRATGPAMGRCLVSNTRLTANRESLRAAFAEALYHRLNSEKN